MRLRRAVSAREVSASSSSPSHLVDATAGTGERPDRDDDGSKGEFLFEARPWLDSDSDDDFYSVRGEFTPSRGSTPDHYYSYRQTPLFSGRMPPAAVVDNTSNKPPASSPAPVVNKKKHRLIELLQEKQHYDDEDYDTATDVSSDRVEDSTVHAEERLEKKKPSSRSGAGKAKKKKPPPKSSSAGCFPVIFIWKKNSFRMCRDVKIVGQRPPK